MCLYSHGIAACFLDSQACKILPGLSIAALEGERAVVLATIIAAGGAWSSCIGQQMLIHENTETMGTLVLPDAPDGLTLQLIEFSAKSYLNR